MKKIVTMLTVAFMLFSSTITSLAYSTENGEYNYLENTRYLEIKANNPKATNNVVVYLYVQGSDATAKNSVNEIVINCMGGEGHEVDEQYGTPLAYPFNPANKKIYDTLSGGDIWVWNFKVENGDYRIANCDSYGRGGRVPPILYLQTDFTFDETHEEFDENGKLFTVYDKEVVTLENTTIRVYGMYGFKSWRDECYDEFKEWAIATETAFKENDSVIENADKVENGDVIENIVVEEPTPEPTLAPTTTPEPTPEVTIPEITEEEANKEKDGEDEKNGNGLLLGGIAVGIFAVIGFVVAKKKK